jgi:hypothetical protein
MASIWKKDYPARQKVALKTLELAITEAVRKSAPQCEPLIGVWVEPCSQRSASDANWSIRGIQFGKADRNGCATALATIVKDMQKDFELLVGSSSGADGRRQSHR